MIFWVLLSSCRRLRKSSINHCSGLAPPPVNGYGPAWTVPNAGNTHKQTPYPEESHIAENVTISEDARVINGHDGMRDSRAEVTKTFKMTEVNVSGKATYVNGISYHNSSSK